MARRRPPRTPTKTLSKQGQLGQRGVNLIERIVLEMGSRWSPGGPNEIGIDGFIELFDPRSRQPLGLVLGVQSKASSSSPPDSAETVDFRCDPRDVQYWLSGNTPIILVFCLPDKDEAYWVSIKHHFASKAGDDSTTIRFNRKEQRFTASVFQELVNVACPPPGLYLAPSPKAELLHSNLLHLDAYPEEMSVGSTECRSPHDVFAVLRRENSETRSGWVLWDKKIYAFHDLSADPWSSICDPGTVETFSSSDWANSVDPDRQRIFVELLNRTLRAQLSSDVRYWAGEDCYAFIGHSGEEDRRIPYQALKRPSKIRVVSHFPYVTQDGTHHEWLRHLAFRGQFRRFEGDWYLEITPTYRFTNDGFGLNRFHEERLKGIKRLEGNRAVLSSVMFWAHHLRPRQSDLFQGSKTQLVFGSLATFPIEVGIDDQRWLSRDPDASRQAKLESTVSLFDEFDEEATV